MEQNIEKLINKAKMQLIFERTFISTLLFKFPIKILDDKQTLTKTKTQAIAFTNGKHIYLNKDEIANTDIKDKISLIRALIKHELGHILFLHTNLPIKTLNKELSNIAMDIMVDHHVEYIEQEKQTLRKLVELPNEEYNIIYHPTIFKYLGKYVDKLDETTWVILYKELLKHAKEVKAIVNMCVNPQQMQLTEEEMMQIKADIQEAIVMAKQQGKGTDNLLLKAEELVKPKIRWQRYLKKAIAIDKRILRSFKRLNKYYISQNVGLPTKIQDKAYKIGVLVDVSGSINQKELTIFLTELLGIVKNKAQILLKTCDVETKDTFKIKSKRDICNIKLKGGGGTDFTETFKEFQDTDISTLIVFTDGYVDEPQKPKNKDLIWCITDKNRLNYFKNGIKIFIDTSIYNL